MVQELPCVAQSPLPTIVYETKEQAEMCKGRDGTAPDCEATEDNTLMIPLTTGSGQGTASAYVRFPFLVDAGVQSIKIFDCVDADGNEDQTGECAGDGDVLMCIDLLDDIPHDESTMMTTTYFADTTEEFVTTTEAVFVTAEKKGRLSSTAAMLTTSVDTAGSTTAGSTAAVDEPTTTSATEVARETAPPTEPATTTTPDATETVPPAEPVPTTVNVGAATLPVAVDTTTSSAKEAKVDDTTAAANRNPTGGEGKTGKKGKKGKKGAKGASSIVFTSLGRTDEEAGNSKGKGKGGKKRSKGGRSRRQLLFSAFRKFKQDAAEDVKDTEEVLGGDTDPWAKAAAFAKTKRQEAAEGKHDTGSTGGGSHAPKKPKKGKGGPSVLDILEDVTGGVARESALTEAEAGLYCFPASVNIEMASFIMMQQSAVNNNLDAGYGAASASNGMSNETYKLFAGLAMALIGVAGIVLQLTSMPKKGRKDRAKVDHAYGTFGVDDYSGSGLHGYALPGGGSDDDAADDDCNFSNDVGARTVDESFIEESISASSAVFGLLPSPAAINRGHNDSDDGAPLSESSAFWGATHHERHTRSMRYDDEMESTYEPAERVPIFSRASDIELASNAVFGALEIDGDEIDPR